MPRRKDSGIAPGIIPKNICQVPLARDEWAAVREYADRYDMTQGHIAALAIRQWLKRRKK